MAMTVLWSIGSRAALGSVPNEQRSEEDKDEMADRICGVVVSRTIFQVFNILLDDRIEGTTGCCGKREKSGREESWRVREQERGSLAEKH